MPINETKSSSSKYRYVQSRLEEAIRSGEFGIGEQMPTEQALAERYNVSYLTARRAVCELVDADLLERRSRKQGTFVRPHGLAKVKTTTLYLITTAYEGAVHRTFLEYGTRLANEQGWLPQIIRLSEGQQDPAVKAIKSDGLALVMLDDFEQDSALGIAIRAALGRVVLFGRDYSARGVPSIWSDAHSSTAMAVRYLRERGHRDIAMITQDVEEALTRRRLAAWQAAMGGQFSDEELEERVIRVKTPLFHCPTRDSYLAMRRFLDERVGDTTAIVCLGDEVTQGVLAACYDSGRPVPAGLSVVNTLDAQSMAFSHPPVTSIDNNMAEQIEIAREIFQAALRGEEVTPRLWPVAPLLIERESVAAPFANGHFLPESRPPVSRQKLELASTT